MATYLIINIVILAILVFSFGVKPSLLNKKWWITLIGLLILTAVFDSVLVIFDIIAYNQDLILGLNVGAAPVEDFFYPLAAALIIPVLWKYFEKKND